MKDIEVFILTRNRVDLLKHSVESILNQTHKVNLTIINNASEDQTESYVKELMKNYDNVHYYKHNEFGPFERNLKTAQDLAKTDYVMFFHDDDVLHPQYIEFAFKLINKYDDIDIICGLLTTFKKQEDVFLEKLNSVRYMLFNNKQEFVQYIYRAFFTDDTSIMFPHVIYKTENIKNIRIETEIYGKIADKPFVLDAIKTGKCIQIRDRRMLNYRIHSGQDTATSKTGPFPYEIINHNKKFRTILNNTYIGKLIFNAYSINWLRLLFNWGENGNKKDFKNFVKEAYKQKAISYYSYCLIDNPFRFIYKYINKIQYKYIDKEFRNLKEYDLIAE